MNSQTLKKLAVAILFASAIAVGYWKFGDLLSLDYLATKEQTLRDYQAKSPLLTYLLAFLVYVTVTGLSLPGATVLTLMYGWFFGWMCGVILVSFASTTGATVAFLVSRYLFREAMQSKFGSRLQQFNEALRREGPFYLFTLRLIPAVPFFVLNAVMGLTPLGTWTFWWISQLGMLPGTCIFVYAGASVPTLAELAERGTSGILSFRVLAALVMLGLFPLVVRYLVNKFAPQKEALIHE